MAEDLAELEMRAAEPERNERPDQAPTRKNDDQSQWEDGRSKDREVQDIDKFPKPLPRWPDVGSLRQKLHKSWKRSEPISLTSVPPRWRAQSCAMQIFLNNLAPSASYGWWRK